MAINQIKRYNEMLEILHFTQGQRTASLRAIFDRDIADNPLFLFRTKLIRPIKKEGVEEVESLFSHLTHMTEEEKDKRGKVIKTRSLFDYDRSKRLHWIWYHIREIKKTDIDIFSYVDRVRGKSVIRTYIYDIAEQYIVILEPHRTQLDYYLISAYYLTEKLGGPKQIENKRNKKLPVVY
ncbi:MAG: hypothetical protein GZ087_07565 [Flavobacterium sp.]|jgi:hypothetical protein|nr:hypothetical protein [Flavobacterium sp.]